MKRHLEKSIRAVLGATMAMAALVTLTAAAGQLPVISSIKIQQSDVVVTVSVPAGVKKVTLESRTRLGAGTWVPRAIKRLDGTATTVTFNVLRSEQLELLRVRGDAEDPLPASVYAGQTNFNGSTSASGVAFGPPEAGIGGVDAKNGEGTREVVESDIWKIRDNTLFFFNQYRGLQVIDVAQPDSPVVRGTLELPAVGEQMYLLDDGHVVLLAGNGCSSSWADSSRILVVDTSASPLRVTASVALEGYLLESRLVGSALYVACNTYRKTVIAFKEGQELWQWESGVLVSSIDLANPALPVARETLWYPGYGTAVTATDKFFFVVPNTGDWWQSSIAMIDISSPDGTMKRLATLSTAGRVADKFKMNMSGNVFTVVSESWNRGGTNRHASVLETFSLANPAAPAKLGEIEVGHGESLYATRFDGDRAYIVTFLRIDPLWVVDLKDPAHPSVSGELQVPGWSTYIHPMGDRLVALGIDNSNSWKVAVSLFDVRDPAKPALLAKVPMGEQQSWSEANYDEKAMTVLPDAGLILVPYQGWTTNGTALRVQLIDLGADSLAARGVIEHKMLPRRATAHADRILSISGRELLTVTAQDRDKPVVTSELELSWAVDRVLLSGDYLIQIANSSYWYVNTAPSLRIASATAPDAILNRLLFTNNLPIVSSEIRESKLYIVQSAAQYASWWWLAEMAGKAATNAPTLFLSVYDLSALPGLDLVGTTEVRTTNSWADSNLKAMWPKPGLLVLSGSGGYGWWGPWMTLDAAPVRGLWCPWWGGYGSGSLLAIDVSDPRSPSVASELNLIGTNAWWSSGEAVELEGLVYLSHQASEFQPARTVPGDGKPPSDSTTTKADGTTETNPPPDGIWVWKHYLDVVDFADPRSPTVRKPVNIPGPLKGVGRGGSLLYTVGPHWADDGSSDWSDYLDVAAYDGLQVYLAASMKLPVTWPRPLTIDKGTVFLGHAGENGAPNALEVWGIDENGKLAQTHSLSLTLPATDIAAYEDVLAVRTSQQVLLYGLGAPMPFESLAEGTPSVCWGGDLRNAAASRDAGLWLPLSEYGLFTLPILKSE